MEQLPYPDTALSLFWGYSVIWAVLAVYILSLGHRVSALEKRLLGDSGKQRPQNGAKG